VPGRVEIWGEYQHMYPTLDAYHHFLHIYDQVFTRLEGELDATYGLRLAQCLVNFHVQLMVYNWLTTQLNVREAAFVPAPAVCMGLNVLQSHNYLSWIPTATSVPTLLALRVLPHVSPQLPALVPQARAGGGGGGAAPDVTHHRTPDRAIHNTNHDPKFVGETPFAVNVLTRHVVVALLTASTPSSHCEWSQWAGVYLVARPMPVF
jgi:hypothetical protein